MNAILISTEADLIQARQKQQIKIYHQEEKMNKT
jgi:hypothetical protein